MDSVAVVERTGVPGAAQLAARLLDRVDALTDRLVQNTLTGDVSGTGATSREIMLTALALGTLPLSGRIAR
jgi:hypothetical protein